MIVLQLHQQHHSRQVRSLLGTVPNGDQKEIVEKRVFRMLRPLKLCFWVLHGKTYTSLHQFSDRLENVLIVSNRQFSDRQ